MGLKEEYKADIVDGYAAAVKAKDYEKVGKFYTPDGTLGWVGTPLGRGPAAIAAAMKAGGEGVDADQDWAPFNDDYVDLGNGHMLSRGEFKMKMGGKEGCYWWTSVCKKVDGKWMLLADCSGPCAA